MLSGMPGGALIAIAGGHVASLLTQERPNIFTQSVANIEPGKAIDVIIHYFHTLAYSDGWYEFVFPMVVGPRFNPPGIADGVGAVPRDKQGWSGQKTEVSYLAPGERSGHDIALRVEMDAGVAIEEAGCRSHAITPERRSPGRAERLQGSRVRSAAQHPFVGHHPPDRSQRDGGRGLRSRRPAVQGATLDTHRLGRSPAGFAKPVRPWSKRALISS
jgi:hypothetical protein